MKFGSNASVWATDLKNELRPARDAIGGVSRMLRDLETTAKNRTQKTKDYLLAVSKEADAVQKKLDKLHSTAGSVQGVDPDSGRVRGMVDDLASYTAEMQGFKTQLGDVVVRLGQASKEFQTAVTREKQSIAQQQGATTQTNAGRVFRAGAVTGEIDRFTDTVIRAFAGKRNKLGLAPGTELPAGISVAGRYSPRPEQLGLKAGQPVPGSVGAAEMRQATAAERDNTRALVQMAAAMAAADAPARAVDIANIPQAVISEASFDRIVDAVNRNVTATEKVEAAVNRLAGRVGGGDDDGGMPDDTDVPRTSTKLTREQNQQLSAAFREVLSETRKSAGKDAETALWKDLVSSQKAALEGGGSIITPAMLERVAAQDSRAAEGKMSEKGVESLRSKWADLDVEAQGLSRELEVLANRMQTDEKAAGVFGKTLNQLAQVEKRRDSARIAYEQEETRSQTRERNRRAALIEQSRAAGIEISPAERQRREGIRAQLALGADPERLTELGTRRGAGGMSKLDLQNLADLFTRQGYETEYRGLDKEGVTRSTKTELIEAIKASGQQYLATRGVTDEDLSLRRVAKPPSEIAGYVSDAISPELREFEQRFTEEFKRLGISPQRAYELLGASARSGGTDPFGVIEPGSVPGSEARKAGRTTGRFMPGSEIGDKDRELVRKAAEVVTQFARERAQAARTGVARELSRDPIGYNPYADDLFAGVEGNDDAAKRVRSNIGATLGAVDEIDNFARGLIKMDESLRRTQRVQQGVIRSLINYEQLDRKPTKDETADYDFNRERLNDLDAEVQQKRTQRDLRLAEGQELLGRDAGFLLDPQYRESIRRRDESRTGSSLIDQDAILGIQELEYLRQERRRSETAPALERSQNRAALSQSIGELFGSPRIFATEQGNTRDYFSRFLPGVKGVGDRSRFRLGPESEEHFQTPADKARATRAFRRMTSGMLGYSNGLFDLIEQTALGEESEERLNERRAKIAAAMNRLAAGYATAYPERTALDISRFLPEQLGFDNDLVARADAGDKEALAQIQRQDKGIRAQVKRDELVAGAKAAYEDPRRGSILTKQNAAALQSNVKDLNEEIRETRAQVNAYGKAATAAERALKQELRPAGRGRVADLRTKIDELATQEAKLYAKSSSYEGAAGRRFDAPLEANQAEQVELRRKLEAELTSSPALQEHRAAELVARKKQEEAQVIERDLKSRRDELQRRRRELIGTPAKKDIEAAEERLARLLEGRAILEQRLASATQHLEQVQSELAAIKSPDRAGEEIGEVDSIANEQLEHFRNQLRDAEARAREADLAGDEGGVEDATSEAMEARRLIGELEAWETAEGRRSASTQRGEPPIGRPQIAGRIQDVGEGSFIYDQLNKAVGRNQVLIRDTSNDLKILDSAIDDASRTVTDLNTTWREQDSRRGAKAEDPANVAGGAGGTGDGGTTAPPGADEPGRPDDILQRILNAVLAVNKTLQGPLKVTRLGGAGEAEAEAIPGVGRGAPRSTPEGRKAFEARIRQAYPDIGQMMDAGKNEQAAAAMIARLKNSTAVLDLFRDKLKQNTEAAKKFREQVAALGGDARFAAIADRAQAAIDKQESKFFDTRPVVRGAGVVAPSERMTVKAAREEMEESLRTDKKKAESSAKSARETRILANETARLAQNMQRLTPETKKEIAELERLAKAADLAGDEQAQLAAQTRLAKQMAVVHGKISQDVGPAREGGGAIVARETSGQIFKAAGVESTGAEMDEVARRAKSLGYKVDSEAAAGVVPGGLFGEQSLFTQAMFGNHGFWSRIMASTGTFVVRNFAAGFVFGMTAALQQVIAQAIETERTFIRVSHALEATGRSSEGLRGDLAGIAQEYGTNLNDVYTIAAGLTGLFDDTESISGATEIVSQLVMISSGALNAQEAMGALASIQGAFADDLGTGVDGLQHVSDVLTSVQNNVGTNVEVTAEAVGRMSGLAAQLGLSYEEVAVYGAQIAKLTNQTGAAAGEQFSRILSVIQTGRGRGALSGLSEFQNREGETVTTDIADQLQARDYSGVLATLQEHWHELTDEQQQNISTTIAGQRQAASFAALMNNGQRSLNAIARAENSHGDAMERTRELMKTLQGQISILGSELQVLASNLLRSGILDFLGIFLNVTNRLLNVINDLFGGLNDLAESNPVVNFAKESIFAILGFVAVVALLRKSWLGLKATLDASPAVQAARANAADRAAGGLGRTGTTIQGFRDSAAARGQSALYAVTGGDQTTRDVGAPIARTVGKVVDAGLLRPLETVGRGLGRFSDTLIARSNQMRTDAAIAGRTAPPLIGSLAGRVGNIGQDIGSLGRGFTFGSDLMRGRTNIADSLRDRAERYGIAGQFARQAFNADPTNPALAKQVVTLNAQAKAADLGSRATSKLSSSMRGLAASGIGADAALVGLMVVIGLIAAEANRQAGAATKINDILEARKQATDPNQDDTRVYKGPAQEALREETKLFTDEGTNFQRFTNFLSTTLTSAPSFFTSFGQADTGFEKSSGTRNNMQFGLEEAQARYDKAMDELREMADQPGTTSEQLLKRQAEITAGFDKAAQKVAQDEDISRQQGLAALASFEQARELMNEGADVIIAEMEGIKEASLLESEQLTRLAELGPALAQLQGHSDVTSSLATGVEALVGEAGITSANPRIKVALDRLSSGGLTNAEVAVEQTVIIRDAAKQAEIKYLSALSRGEVDEIEEKRGQFLQLMGQLAASTQSTIDTFVNEATLISQAAFNLGDYAGGREALQKAIDEAEALRPEGTLAPGAQGDLRDPTFRTTKQRVFTPADIQRNLEIDAQVRPLYQAQLQSSITEENATLKLQAARGLGEVAGARNNLQQQRNALSLMQQAKRENEALGPTADEIREQQILVLQAKAQMAASLASRDVARMALAAAGEWNEVAANLASEQIAMRQLEAAIDQFGRGSTQALGARTNLRNARKSRIQSQDAEQQAARETALAAIPVGDQVAVAQQGLRNALANLADARKYGQTSTQYQSALQQLYSAQQAVNNSQVAVQTAQLQLAQAYANASGNAVGAAQIGVQLAQVQYAAALEASGGAQSADTLAAQAQIVAANDAVRQANQDLAVAQVGIMTARADAVGDAVRSAQLQAKAARIALSYTTAGTAEHAQAMAQLIAANAAIGDAQLELIQSRIGVSIAIAEAAGNTVRAARLQLKVAMAALKAATPGTAEYAQAKAQTIAARAGIRDAMLQDRLDTIEFNLEMGRTTTSAAISALREILRTSDLTREQRRSLMLQIKGMQEELSGSPWNFGDIKLPKPYLMKRYIEEQRRQQQALYPVTIADVKNPGGGAMGPSGLYEDNRNIEIVIMGGNERRIREIFREMVGKPARTRTAASRRGRR